MVALTAKQLALVRLVWTFRREEGRPPTLRELATTLGRSHITVWEAVNALVKKGALQQGPREGRRHLAVPEEVAEELALLDSRETRLRAWAAQVARSHRCSGLSPCPCAERIACLLESDSVPIPPRL